MAGMSLSDYLRQELEQIAAQLTYEELKSRLAELPVAKVAETAADAVRAERDTR